ncbi:hypothetical protein H2200_001752 [Cladophialophora chaetospira]|uniref:Zn(2)-C6 fungal-type domain-containing protein n=1 Tax=Cladophialophora chaetospira TaxID=386627 RepID=A0AA38XLL2_9EURO|nr:hypothetical protein H2200_001752 [Cladophialophora chaetospira]
MSESSSTPVAGMEQPKRPRPVISCLECRRKKLKCSRTHPCQQCVKIGRPGRCTYQAGQEPEPNAEYSVSYNAPSKRQRLLPTSLTNVGDTSSDRAGPRKADSTAAKRGVIEELQERVTRLEQALLTQHRQPNGASSPAPPMPPRPQASDNAANDGRSLSRSPQLSSQFSDASMIMTRLAYDHTTPEIIQLRADLRNLHCSIEMNHSKTQSLATSVTATKSYPLQLPSLELCKKLGVLYFDNMEHCFRILHWPNFRDQLEILFTDGEHACKFGFLPQLVGTLAVAVLLGTHQECEAAGTCSTIRPREAIRYMGDFLHSLQHHERYRLPALQVKMLLLICKWLNLDPFDDLFRLNGELLRDALVMKMDKDPIILRDIGVYEGELRRRNWMTIIEVDLMLSLLCKMPCMVPPYTSSPPRNVNDEEIFEGMESLPTSRPTQEWTDGLCQYLLAQSFPRRVTACLEVGRSDRVVVDEVLAHTRYLEKVLQDLPPPMRFNYLGDEASKTPARLMARMELDISIRRPLMLLYSRCVLSPEATNDQREIRAGLLQSCLMVGNYQDLFDPQYSELDVPRSQGYWDFFYTCYRQELGQSTMGLCLQIKHLGDTDRTDCLTAASSRPSSNNSTNTMPTGPLYNQGSLINAVNDALEPMRRRLPHRASKLKDVIYYDMILTSLLPLRPGQDRESMMIQRLQGLVDECRGELSRANIPYFIAPEPRSERTLTDGGVSGIPIEFDPLWEGFPDVDILDPIQSFETLAESGA